MSEPEPAMATMEAEVPRGMVAGSQFFVRAPDGSSVRVTLPRGLSVGDKFHVAMPDALATQRKMLDDAFQTREDVDEEDSMARAAWEDGSMESGTEEAMREQSGMGTREGSKVKTRSASFGKKVKTRSASFGKKVAKEVGKAGRTAALKVRRARAANLTFEASATNGGIISRKFSIVNKLGEGGYSTIWSVRERQPDGAEVEYAVKRVLIDGSDSGQLALVEGEIAAMRSLPPHPNIVTLLGFCRKPRAAGGGGRSELDEFYLLLEMCAGGSLVGMLQRRHKEGAPLQPAEVLRIFLDMCHAVAHMHAQQPPLAHRDVKPENFVLSGEDGLWKLCDFGSASSEHFQHVEGTRFAAVAAEEERVHRHSTPQYALLEAVLAEGLGEHRLGHDHTLH